MHPSLQPLTRALSTLRAAVRRHVTFRETPPNEQAAFETYARDLSARSAEFVAMLCLVLCVLWWPLDGLLLDARSPQAAASARWSPMLAVASMVFIALLRFGPRGLRRSYAFLTFLASSLASVPAWGLALTGGLEQPAFGALYFTPFCAITTPAPIGTRVLGTSLIGVATMGTFFLSRPESLLHPLRGTVYGCQACMVAASITIGHLMTLLLRRSFLQARELEARAQALTELDRLKSDFFANLSHELRTPIALILGSFRQLARVDSVHDARAAVEPGLRNAAHLLRLIDDLFELSRIDHGRARDERRTLDLGALVRGVVAAFGQARGALVCEVDEAPVLVHADARRLRMVLYNLLGNALKFTDASRREISVRLVRERDGWATLSVRDNGVGIESELLPRVFERFVQGTSGSTRRFGGTGIGLAVVREVVEAHGGTVAVESRLGEGSTFTVRLRRVDDEGAAPGERESDEGPLEWLAPSPARASQGSVARAAAGAERVLVVDDNADLRDYVARLLEPSYEVRTVDSGAAALALLTEWTPALVISDVMMPGLDGAELLRALRAAHPADVLPVLFLTARSDPTARIDALSAGVDDYLTKPFDERELLARVRNLLALRRSGRALAQANTQLEALNEALETRVEARAAALRELAGYLERVEETERGRIAAELHDELGQLLSALRLEAERLQREGGGPAHEALVSHIDECLSATRRVVTSLRPRALDERRFGDAVAWMLEGWADRSGVECEWLVEVDDERVEPAVATAAYRVLQEALTNVVRHARASRVQVSLRTEGDALTLRVRDDGVGFDPATAPDARRFGMVGMRERARLHRGVYGVESAPGRGTCIEVAFPLEARDRTGEPPARGSEAA